MNKPYADPLQLMIVRDAAGGTFRVMRCHWQRGDTLLPTFTRNGYEKPRGLVDRNTVVAA